MAATRSTRSMFGDQTLSRRTSAPQYGFGSSTRDHQAKVFTSQEHAKLSAPRDSPGPAVYSLRASVGAQVDGRKSSSPQWAFGTADRFLGGGRAGAMPGPGSYESKSGLGPQVASQRGSTPLYGFGSSTRENVRNVFVSEGHNKDKFGLHSPGPAVYQSGGSIGKQATPTTI